jgi:hypothetical protein
MTYISPPLGFANALLLREKKTVNFWVSSCENFTSYEARSSPKTNLQRSPERFFYSDRADQKSLGLGRVQARARRTGSGSGFYLTNQKPAHEWSRVLG